MKKTTVETPKPHKPASVTAGLPSQTMAAHIRSDAQATAITTLEAGHLERSDISAPNVVQAANGHQLLLQGRPLRRCVESAMWSVKGSKWHHARLRNRVSVESRGRYQQRKEPP